MSKVKDVEMEQWEIKNAVDTLQRAEEIRANPTMMKKVKAEAMKQKQSLDKVVKKAPAKKSTVKKKTAIRRKK